jgi:hypothetical protein
MEYNGIYSIGYSTTVVSVLKFRYEAQCWPSTSLDKCRKFALRTSLACLVTCHMRKEAEVGQK